MQVTTVLTVYGIETFNALDWILREAQVTTVLTVYGIETVNVSTDEIKAIIEVTTVLTVYGIETLQR